MKKITAVLIITIILSTLLVACKPEIVVQSTPENTKGTEVPKGSDEIIPIQPAADTSKSLTIKKDGTETKIPLIIDNGEYLCEAGENNILFGRTEDSVMKLVKKDTDSGEETTLPDEFTLIESAKVSSSGNYIAVLDIFEESRTLYVYDIKNEDIYNLGEDRHISVCM